MRGGNRNLAFRLDELAARSGCELRGEAGLLIRGVATLASAGPDQLSFLANPRYRSQLAGCRAGAVVLRVEDAAGFAGNCLLTAEPHVAFTCVARLFEVTRSRPPGVHPSAVVATGVEIPESAHIGPHSSIGGGCRIGENVVIGPGCVIGEDCEIGDDSELVARVTLVTRVRLGRRVLIHPGAVLGADGFGLARSGDRWMKVPQLGGVRIGDDCEIGANTTIDRGALDDTVLEEDVRLDNQVQIGHNVYIGAHSALAGCVGVSGSCRIGRRCLLGGAVGLAGHLELCDDVTVTGYSLVANSIRTPGVYGSGVSCQEQRLWRRNLARLHHLDEFARRLQALERKKEK